MAKLNENLNVILAHLKTKGLSIKDVSDLAFFFSVDDRERFYKWLRRVKTETDSRSNPKFERALLCILHSFRVTGKQRYPSDPLFDVQKCLSRFDLVENLDDLWSAPLNFERLGRLAKALEWKFRHFDGIQELIGFLDNPSMLGTELLERLKADPQTSPAPELPRPFAGLAGEVKKSELDAKVLDRIRERVHTAKDDEVLNDLLKGTETIPAFQAPNASWLRAKIRNMVTARLEKGLQFTAAIDDVLDDFKRSRIGNALEMKPAKLTTKPPLPTLDSHLASVEARLNKRIEEKILDRIKERVRASGERGADARDLVLRDLLSGRKPDKVLLGHPKLFDPRSKWFLKKVIQNVMARVTGETPTLEQAVELMLDEYRDRGAAIFSG